jgi:hypothetical protein
VQRTYEFVVEKVKGIDQLGNLGVDENNIKMGLMGVEWIHVDRDGMQWRNLANTAMSLRVPYKAGNLVIN